MGACLSARGALITAAALFTMLCFAVPATAQTGTFTDAKRDVEYFSGKTQATTYGANGLDIYSARIRYTDGKLVIRTKFDNLTRCNTEWLSRCRPWRPHQYVYLDTTPDPAGEMYQDEYHVFYLDHHVGLSDTNGIRSCRGLRWRSNLQLETSTFVVPRSCLRRGDRHRVRVRVLASKHGKNYPKTSSSDMVSDTLDWTPWIRHS